MVGVATFIEASKRLLSAAVNRATAGVLLEFGTTATITTASAVTLTAAQLAGGLILRDPNGAGRSDTTPTAALLVAYFSNGGLRPIIGQRFEFIIKNTADAAETITILAGTGCTLSGTMTIAQNNLKRFLVEFTGVNAGAEAYTLYSQGSSAF